MKLERISSLNEAFRYSAELRSRWESLNARISRHNDEVDAFVTRVESIAASPDLDADELPDARAGKIKLLADEQAIRLDIRSFYAEREVERQELADELHEAHFQAGETVKRKLLQIGYSETPIEGANQPSLIPDMIHRHPDVRRARNLLSECRVNGSEDNQANEKRLAALENARQEQQHKLRQQLHNLV